MKKIEFSSHSKAQRKKRNILLTDILKTINFPDRIVGSFRNRTIMQKKFNDRVLEVVTVQENDIIIVITQYYLEL